MKRVAYGFRDERYFQLRLYALHGCRITPNVDEANFLGNRYSVRTQDKYFVRLRVDGDVSREGFSVLGVIQLSCQDFLWQAVSLPPQPKTYAPYKGNPDVALYAGNVQQAQCCRFLPFEKSGKLLCKRCCAKGNGDGYELTLLPREHFV